MKVSKANGIDNKKANGNILDRIHYVLLGVIFALAIIFRIVAINWGLPNTNLHPDEGIIFIKAYECARDRSFEVEDYYYRPNHVLIKMNTLLYIGIQDLYFQPKGMDDFELNFLEHISTFIVGSRIIVALFGIGIVVLSYFIACNWGKRQALFASMLFAVFPAFIEHSHYITPDVPLLFFLMCVIYVGIRYLKKPSVIKLFFMALFSAIATCEKFTGIFGCVILAVTVCVTYYKKPLMILREGVIAILMYVAGIMAVSPILIVDYKDVIVAAEGQNALYHLGGDGLNFGQTIWYYLKTTGEHVGLILTLGSIYGVIRSFKKDWKASAIIITFLVYLIPISTLHIHWERYTLPLYAVALFFGSFGLFYAFEDIHKLLKKHKVAKLACVLIMFLLPMGSLMAGSMAMCGSFLAPDSRIFLQDVFEEMNINENNTCHDCNTPLDPGGYYGAFSNFENADPTKFKYGTVYFVMTSSSQRDEFFAGNQEYYGGVANFYHKLDEEHELVYLFTVENPSSHFIELQNIWYSARTVYRYMKGACKGFEIRLYRLIL